ncbi:MAG TPA: hypothetical protein PKD53_01180 [Chloroflexaceae bacterium]|nr:hypothetical protein [Chloroflexaceae bacterium]
MPSLPHIPRAALGPIALASLLVLLAWRFSWGQPPPARFTPPGALQHLTTAERPVPPGAPTPTPVPLTGSYAPPAEGMQLVVAEGLLDELERARLAADLERALAYVVERFGTSPAGEINTYVGLEPTCGLHGIAYTEVRTVQVFTCRDLPIGRAINIMAHEYVHQLSHDRYGEPHMRADLVLLEGIATWGAGAYWLGGAPDFRSFVRPWLDRGENIPLHESYVGLPVSDMNKLYYQWGSFVEFLIEVYGREKLDQVYLTGQNYPASADYLGVYGKRFDELEAEWHAWVLR